MVSDSLHLKLRFYLLCVKCEQEALQSVLLKSKVIVNKVNISYVMFFARC